LPAPDLDRVVADAELRGEFARGEDAPVQVIWERRVGERRRGSEGVAHERRWSERRGPGLGLRHLLGFLLAWSEPAVPNQARSG
jgi:hypothetical protein